MQTTLESCRRELPVVQAVEASNARPTLERTYLAHALDVRSWIRARISSNLRASLDLDDVAQEVWLRVARSYDRFDPRRGPVRSWVFGIMQHTLCDFLRRSRTAPMSLDEPPELAAAAAPCQGSTERLLEELATFSSADRELVRICAFEGRSTCEAARELAISSAAARKRWSRLRSRLARRTGLAARSG